LQPVLVGLVAGSLGAIFTSRLLGTLLFNVKPGDPSVFAMIAAALAGAAILASLVPARRATRVDPVQVLRAD
jgi:ABC-type antimicrobial peptide transport system permease subunit